MKEFHYGRQTLGTAPLPPSPYQVSSVGSPEPTCLADFLLGMLILSKEALEPDVLLNARLSSHFLPLPT